MGIELLLISKMLLVFVAVPVVTLWLSKWNNQQAKDIIMVTLVVALIPLCLGFQYVGRPVLAYVLCVAIVLSLISARVFTLGGKIEKQIWPVFGVTILFLVGFGLFAVLGSLVGSETTPQIWRTNDSVIEYRVEQGFAGSPLQTYVWYEKSALPILMRKITESTKLDTLNKCRVLFEEVDCVFDQCIGNFETTCL